MRSTARISLNRQRVIAIGQLDAQLGLERDHRQRMPEQIVEIPGDALAFRYFGHLSDIFVRAPKENGLPDRIADEEIPATDDEDSEGNPGADDDAFRVGDEPCFSPHRAGQHGKEQD